MQSLAVGPAAGVAGRSMNSNALNCRPRGGCLSIDIATVEVDGRGDRGDQCTGGWPAGRPAGQPPPPLGIASERQSVTVTRQTGRCPAVVATQRAEHRVTLALPLPLAFTALASGYQLLARPPLAQTSVLPDEQATSASSRAICNFF
jgi:hypothetical protein